jgi:energy-coupling factor transport system permease protein
LQVNLSFKASQIAPGAWWLLGLSFAICAGISSNTPTLLAIQILAVFIVLLAREDAPWSRSLLFYICTAALVVLIRVTFRIIFNFDSPDQVALNLPAIRIPFGPLGEIDLLGRVSQSSIAAALRDGLRMSAIILSIGMANSLANPRRLLKSTPAALYGVTSSFVIALNLAPQLIASAKRIRLSSQLRNESNRPSKGVRLISPILEDSIDRSMALAASMDARGFGRRGNLTKLQIRFSRVASLVSISALACGAYLLLTADAPWATVVTFTLGLSGIYTSLKISGTSNLRTRYATHTWQLRESLLAGASALLVVLFALGALR